MPLCVVRMYSNCVNTHMCLCLWGVCGEELRPRVLCVACVCVNVHGDLHSSSSVAPAKKINHGSIPMFPGTAHYMFSPRVPCGCGNNGLKRIDTAEGDLQSDSHPNFPFDRKSEEQTGDLSYQESQANW